MSVLYRIVVRLIFLVVILFPLVAAVRPAQADDPFQISVEIGEITPPTSCDEHYWTISYQRTTTITGVRSTGLSGARPAPVMRYFVQYVDDEVNLVHFWLSGYDAYVQDYIVSPYNPESAWAKGSYAVPLWSDSYQAMTIEYLVYEDRAVWETRASLECDDGKVISFDITSQAADRTVDSLPKPGPNLVLALDDIPLYRDPFNNKGYLGTIRACQTFYISNVERPRASISTWVRESLTGQRMLLGYDGGEHLPIVDVHEDYGQPGGQAILDPCTGA